MKVAVLGLGEAGIMYSQAFAEAGCEVRGFDIRQVAVPEGVTFVPSVAEAVHNADLILSLVTSRGALAVAQEVRESVTSAAVYIDLNSASPAKKLEVQDALDGSVKMVDGAVIGSVMKYGAKVHLLLSGEFAQEAAESMSVIGSDAEAIGGAVGDASQRKLLRSVFMKGLGALIAEAMQAGEETGQVKWMRTQIANELIDGEATLDRLNDGTKIHALRRAHELKDSLDQLQLNACESLNWPVTRGALDVHKYWARTTGSSIVEELAQVPTAALGDGGDRLGVVHSSIKQTWKSRAIAGKAFTVYTREGDNQAIHRALKEAAPGDILVVSGGGFTERALMGELIAQRAQNAGIIGMVIDGAVRDVDELEKLDFPVWAAGVSPAGPYKHGPGRLGVPVSIGGVVCQHRDFVVADADGVVVIPGESAEQHLHAGLAVVADEASRRELIRATVPVT
ncbi:dimethylmenaquinone methyltransferase [Corynebacterium suranareeae]|uniref:Putative 4-hydroxy-4-methyl-2-oxoglutarate aldolase n=1 Tax=Corynebacterium suranareeae TaxID=2506452 RepID=A0A160PPD9_9CORY|nr:NAD(P)-binding domain-containing protein [Corynebacterium suranareeae]BAU95336.1 dimethylmenaquinone methyltransferase [Corynebacterium suranareeae]